MNDLTAEIESLNQWKGHEERVEEILSPLKVEGYHAVLDTGERVSNDLRKYLRLFNGISTISPLLGLLGTLLGKA